MGLTPAETLDMTPAEICLMIEGYCDRRDEEHNKAIMQAYYTAGLSNSKRLPKLEKLLIKPKKRKTKDEPPKDIAAEWEEIDKIFDS